MHASTREAYFTLDPHYAAASHPLRLKFQTVVRDDRHIYGCFNALLGLVFAAALCAGAAYLAYTYATHWLAWGTSACMGALGVFCTVSAVQSVTTFARLRARYARLKSDQGTVLTGSLTGSRFVWRSVYRNADAPHRVFLEVSYEFQSPASGRVLTATQAKRLPPLRARPPLPMPGTPVRVLYADDRTFVML